MTTQPDSSVELITFGALDALVLPATVDITDRVTCTLDLLPKTHVAGVTLDISDGPATASELELVNRLLTEPVLADPLEGVALASFMLADPLASRAWSVENALHMRSAAELLDLEQTEDGLGAASVHSIDAAARAIVGLPPLVRELGANRLRLAAGSVVAQLRMGADESTVEMLRSLAEAWPVADEDRVTLPVDAELAALLDEPAGLRPIHEFADAGALDDVITGIPLDLDLSSLRSVGLVNPGVAATGSMVLGPESPTWEIRVAVRPQTASAFLALEATWLERRALEPGDVRRASLADRLALEYGRLFAATHLPVAIDVYLGSVALERDKPPHLLDVACVLSDEKDRVGHFSFVEEHRPDGGLDLVAVLPHDGQPSGATVTIGLLWGRNTFQESNRQNEAERLLACRLLWRAGMPLPRRHADALKVIIANLRADPVSHDAADALERERDLAAEEHKRREKGGDGSLDSPPAAYEPAVQSLVEALVPVHAQVVVQLQEAVDSGDVAKTIELSICLWKLRAFLYSKP